MSTETKRTTYISVRAKSKGFLERLREMPNIKSLKETLLEKYLLRCLGEVGTGIKDHKAGIKATLIQQEELNL